MSGGLSACQARKPGTEPEGTFELSNPFGFQTRALLMMFYAALMQRATMGTCISSHEDREPSVAAAGGNAAHFPHLHRAEGSHDLGIYLGRGSLCDIV